MPDKNPFIGEESTPKAATRPKPEPTIGNAAQKSRQKADHARQQAEKSREMVDSEAWPRGVNGQPMFKVTMTAAELLPTGQFANISIGPAQITAFVDQDRLLADDQGYFTQAQRDTLARALNELAEIVEADVVAVQRNLVQEHVQKQVEALGNSGKA
jgi:hypothetical protein